jgi:hypothetical protein
MASVGKSVDLANGTTLMTGSIDGSRIVAGANSLM